MIWIVLALVTAPITMPLTARLALGRHEAGVFICAMFAGCILALLGVLLAVDPGLA